MIVVGDQQQRYGLVVDRFLGERELVVQPLDPRLGKIKDISAGALMEDGSPVLIVDVEDLLRSMEKLAPAGRLGKRRSGAARRARSRASACWWSTTRSPCASSSASCSSSRGYEVEVAVDGMDGWNAVRTGHFDLVVTDIDMPRMDGIELVTLIKQGSAI